MLDDRVETFLSSRPHTPAAVRPWLQLHPAYDRLAAWGVAKLVNDLLTAVLTDMPPDVRQYVSEKLEGNEPGPSTGTADLSTHEVRAKGTRSAVEQYAAEHSVMELFADMVEAALAEMRGAEGVPTPVDFLKRYLKGI